MLKHALAVVGLVTVVTIGLSGRPAIAAAPVVFVPEFCSASSGFADLMRDLPDRRFGDELAVVSFDPDGRLLAPANGSAATSFAIDYRAPQGDASASRIGIRDKANELKRVIDFVKATTGSTEVILVGHGMGGLVSRAYVQGLGINAGGEGVSYDADVAGVITIDAPHRGVTAETMPAEWNAACASAASTNWREMQPNVPGSLLEVMNQAPWPAGVRLDAIASYYSERAALDTDGVVLRESQDPRGISSYWNALGDVHVWEQPLAARRVSAAPQLAAHNAIARAATTASLIDGIVQEIDRQFLAERSHAFETNGLPESAHDYNNDTDTSWSYTLAGNPSSIDVMFDPRTNVEEDYDYIYVMDASGRNVSGSPFTGDMLAGRTLRISGSTVRIRLTSDESINEFGFKLASVNASSGNVATSPLPESSHPYDNSYHGGWFYTADGNPGAINVTFDSRTKVEADYDEIHVTDAEGREMGDSPYTGTELAGKTVRVQGSSVRVILDSDGSTTDFGYKVTSVTGVSGNTASLSSYGVSSTSERTSTGVTYHATLTVCETGGRSSISIASIRATLKSSTRTGTITFAAGSNLNTTSIAAGSCHTFTFNITSTITTEFYTSLSFVITYSDATGVQTSYTPTSGSITPPASTTAPPTTTTPTTGSRFDGVYNWYFTYPSGGGVTSSSNTARYITIRNGRLTSASGEISGSVTSGGRVTMVSDCPLQRLTYGADWIGDMNLSAAAGANSGSGTYQCREPLGGTRTWRITQTR